MYCLGVDLVGRDGEKKMISNENDAILGLKIVFGGQ
jgi:hypothetical protein